MLSILAAIALISPSRSNTLQFYEHSTTSHFRHTSQQKIGVSNVPDMTARLLQMGVFVKAYNPPQFLTFPKAPKGNLFVYVPHYTGEPLKNSVVSFDIDGYAKISEIFAGSNAPEDTSSSLPDLTSAHFNSKMICASHCAHLAKSMCGVSTDKIAAPSKSQQIDSDFVKKFNVPKDMDKEFVLEMQFLAGVRQNGEVAVFLGVSSFKKVSPEQQKEAKRILEDVIMSVLKEMPDNSVAEVLTMGSSSGLDGDVSMVANRRLLATPATTTTVMIHLPGEFLAQIWVSVGGLFVVIAVAYYLAFMDYTQDSVLYTTMDPNLSERRR